MLKLWFILAIVTIFHYTHGRKCWHCENALGQRDCLLKGDLVQCLTNQEYCQSEIRAIGGGRHFEISKRCKQDNSCTNNQIQNFTGSYPFQCETELLHSVCRCCCGFDNCNGPVYGCLQDPPDCEKPDELDNGLVLCPPSHKVGQTCFYRCKRGYKLQGATKTTCELTGFSLVPEWTGEPPICETKPCRDLIIPEGGTMSCTDQSNIGSKCTFGCDPGRVLVGRERLTCSHLSIWDEPEPECSVVNCFPPRPLDPNFVPRTGECTDGYNYESTCTFTCHTDYERKGAESILCGGRINEKNKKAQWSGKPPRCIKRTCLPAHPQCPKNEIGDTCDIKCPECRKGGGNITCTSGGWSGNLPTCATIECGEPPAAPVNGAQSCEPGVHECGDACTFTCDNDYRLVGSRITRCLANEEWSHGTPTCERRICQPDYPVSDLCPGNEVGDACKVVCPRCERGGGTITCTSGGWNGTLPTCSKITCGPPPESPVNGGRSCNSSANECGDSCTFVCDENYERVGSSDTVCLPSGRWSNPTPVCEIKECSAYPGRNPREDAGSIKCDALTSGLLPPIDSSCKLTCNKNFVAKDLVTDTTCTETAGTLGWTVRDLCCVECLQNSNIDLVVLLDKTEEGEDGNLWNFRLNFTGRLLRYLADLGFNFNVTFIPFGDDLDITTYRNFITIDRDSSERSDFLVGQRGSSDSSQASNSGKALQWALDNIFGFHSGRYPAIFLLTSRAPSDMRIAKAAAEEIKRRNMHLRILPIVGERRADPGPNKNDFLSLVEEEQYVFDRSRPGDTEEDFLSFAGDELISVTSKLCNAPEQNTQQCVF